MAQRKSPSASKAPGSKAGSGSPGKAPGKGAARPPAGGRPAGRPPVKKGKSIVNQKQTPWGMIITTAAVVVFAVAVVIVVIATRGKSSNTSGADPAYVRAEIAAAKNISGLKYHKEPNHTHQEGVLKYDRTPPIGGNHSQYWADCSGTVYTQPIANENAVHMLEHGAIWITYNADKIKGAQLEALKKYVSGIDRMALSPYPNLKSPISLQAWNYQLFVDSPTDPRIAQFIAALKYNQKTTPEYGATCSQPSFKQHPSTFGHPLWVPASGASGSVMGS